MNELYDKLTVYLPGSDFGNGADGLKCALTTDFLPVTTDLPICTVFKAMYFGQLFLRKRMRSKYFSMDISDVF